MTSTSLALRHALNQERVFYLENQTLIKTVSTEAREALVKFLNTYLTSLK